MTQPVTGDDVSAAAELIREQRWVPYNLHEAVFGVAQRVVELLIEGLR